MFGSELVEKHVCLRRFAQHASGHKPLVCQDALAFLSAAKRVGSGGNALGALPPVTVSCLLAGRSCSIHAGGKVSHYWRVPGGRTG